MAAAGRSARARPCSACSVCIALLVTYAHRHRLEPAAGWANWLANVSAGPLSKPGTTWVKRAGNEPDHGGRGAATHRGRRPRARSRRTASAPARRCWSKPADVGGGRPAPTGRWSSSAGRRKGFDVYDVTTGILQWQRTENLGVWPYADKVLLLHCVNGTLRPAVGRFDHRQGRRSDRLAADPDRHRAAADRRRSRPVDAGPDHVVVRRQPDRDAGPRTRADRAAMAGKMHIIRTGNGAEIKPPIPVSRALAPGR